LELTSKISGIGGREISLVFEGLEDGFQGTKEKKSHWDANGDLLELSNPSKYRFFYLLELSNPSKYRFFSLGIGISVLLKMLLSPS